MLPGPVMFEVSPPSKRSSADAVGKAVAKIADAVKRTRCIDALNVPEIIAENRDGEPLYRNMDVLEFASLVYKATGKPVAVNKVVAFFSSAEEFDSWLGRASAQGGICAAVLVGGSSDAVRYLGPPVIEADRRATAFAGTGVGNISIPERQGEAARVLAKTAAGCSFFTTQVIMEPESTLALLKEYSGKCGETGIAPATFYLSLAPVGDAHDLEFLKWLGAKVPQEVESRLAGSSDMASESVEIALQTFNAILDSAESRAPDVPLALNVEPISMHNLEPAERLLLRLEKRTRTAPKWIAAHGEAAVSSR
ncbi:MAG: hypothetical protein V1787_00615 [Candidatus Micrarchaeota archaeon]